MKKVILILSVFLISLAAMCQKPDTLKRDTVFGAALQQIYERYSTVVISGKYLYGLDDNQVGLQLQAFIRVLNEAVLEWNRKKKQ